MCIYLTFAFLLCNHFSLSHAWYCCIDGSQIDMLGLAYTLCLAVTRHVVIQALVHLAASPLAVTALPLHVLFLCLSLSYYHPRFYFHLEMMRYLSYLFIYSGCLLWGVWHATQTPQLGVKPLMLQSCGMCLNHQVTSLWQICLISLVSYKQQISVTIS